MELLEWNLRATWKYKNETTDCKICKENLTDHCITCIENNSGETIDCPIIKGACNHCFHKHCLENCHKNAQIEVCPIDKIKWKISSN